jgi:hypothetical protein
MTAFHFETEDGSKLDIDTVYLDYSCDLIENDYALEGLRFIVKVSNQKLEFSIHPDYQVQFNTLNTEYWLREIIELFNNDYAEFTHPKTGEVVFLRTPEQLAHSSL